MLYNQIPRKRLHLFTTSVYNFPKGFYFAADAGKGLIRFEFIGVEYSFLILSPAVRLFLITGITAEVLFFAFFAVAARTGTETGFSSSELDDVRLGFGVNCLERSSHEDSLELPIVFVRRFRLKGFRKLPVDGERRWKLPDGVDGVCKFTTVKLKLLQRDF